MIITPSKRNSAQWASALCRLAFSSLLVLPTLNITTFEASAQLNDVEMGGGKGGDGGATAEGPAKEGSVGSEGFGGKGGDGYSTPNSPVSPPAGGQPEQETAIVDTPGTTTQNLHGGNGGAGADVTAGDLSNFLSPGGGAGGGTALFINGNDPSTFTLTQQSFHSMTGGNGGDGGSNSNDETFAGNGGGGGAGVYVWKAELINRGTITGGRGGNGGNAFEKLGRGGDGGYGVILSDGSNLTNSGSINGGNGGAPGSYLENGFPAPLGYGGGTGGGGVYMENNSTLDNTGTIKGGYSGNTGGQKGEAAIVIHGNGNTIINNGNLIAGGAGQEQNAVLIEGDDNVLQLLDNSTIQGRVVSIGSNILELTTISNDRIFDVSGSYSGFSSYIKNGAGYLSLRGQTNEVTPWTVSEGTLAIDTDKRLGDENGTLTLAGGKLEILNDESSAWIEISRPIRVQDHGFNFIETQANTIIYSAIAGTGGLIKSGSGTLILINDNLYDGNTLVQEGVLQLGGGGPQGSVLNSIHVVGGAFLDINHSDIFELNNIIDGDGTVRVVGGTEAIFTADSVDFDGNVGIATEAALTIRGAIGGTIHNFGTLKGDGNVENVINHGLLIPAGEHALGMVIEGNYTGDEGSTIRIVGDLGDDTSVVSQLTIYGDAKGSSNVEVKNLEGKGGDTQKGIEVISVGGQSDAVFTLDSKDKTGWGVPAVIVGAHAYTLQKGSASDPSDGNWYLRTTFNRTVCPSPEPGQPAQPCTPSCPSPEPGQPAQPCTPTCSLTEPEACSPTGEIYQPGVPLYTGYGQFVSSLNTVSSMEQRIGNRYWSGASARQIMQGDGPGMDEIPDPNSPQILTDAGLIWGRINAAHSRMQLYNSTINTSYDSDQWNIRAGIDHQLKEYTTSRLIGSVWLEYGSAKADLSSYFGSGDIDVNSYSLGTAITWFHENGFYLDGQGRFSWTRSDITSSTLNRTLVSGAKGDGFAFGLEAGRRLALNAVWSWTPQAQIIWSQTRLDDFSDPYEAEVSFDAFKNLTARAGVTVQYANTWQDRNGYTTRGQVYALANLYRELLGQSPSVIISEEKLKPGNADRNWGEVGLGGTYAFHNDKYALYGETALAGGLDDIKNNYTLRGNVGLRVHW